MPEEVPVPIMEMKNDEKNIFASGMLHGSFPLPNSFRGNAPFLLLVSSEESKTTLLENKKYRLTDNYYNPQEFDDFRKNPENINMLADFYNNLEKAGSFRTVSMFNQALHVKEFKGDDRFYYNSQEFIQSNISSWINIKAMQMNKEAYDFYGIKISSGNDIPWESVLYEDVPVPVLLGADYKEVFQQGEIINANYYSRNMEFEVAGFLEEKSSVEYWGDSEFSLDTYIIIPYPEKLWHVENDVQFESILYFAMINCDILPLADETQILQEIEEISDRTGFSAFSLTGMDGLF